MRHKGEKGEKSINPELPTGLRLWAPEAQSLWNLLGKWRGIRFRTTTSEDRGGAFTHHFHLPWAEVYSGGVRPPHQTHTHFYIFRSNLLPVCPHSSQAEKQREQEAEVGICLCIKKLSPTGVGERRRAKGIWGRIWMVSAKQPKAGYLSTPSICI